MGAHLRGVRDLANRVRVPSGARRKFQFSAMGTQYVEVKPCNNISRLEPTKPARFFDLAQVLCRRKTISSWSRAPSVRVAPLRPGSTSTCSARCRRTGAGIVLAQGCGLLRHLCQAAEALAER